MKVDKYVLGLGLVAIWLILSADSIYGSKEPLRQPVRDPGDLSWYTAIGVEVTSPQAIDFIPFPLTVNIGSLSWVIARREDFPLSSVPIECPADLFLTVDECWFVKYE